MCQSQILTISFPHSHGHFLVLLTKELIREDINSSLTNDYVYCQSRLTEY